MGRLNVLLIAACACGLLPEVGRLGLVPWALTLVAFGVAFALAASGACNSLAVAFGSMGVLAGVAVAGWSACVGSALLVGFAYAERTMRVVGTRRRILHVMCSLAGGALAGFLTLRFGVAPPLERWIAVAVSAVLVALPLLFGADHPIADAIESAARVVGEPASTNLREAASLHRCSADIPLDRETTRQVGHTWRSLVKLAQARVRLERTLEIGPPQRTSTDTPSGANSVAVRKPVEAVRRMLDQRIGEHVAVLRRMMMAVDAAHAASAGLESISLHAVQGVGESMECMSDALVQVGLESPELR